MTEFLITLATKLVIALVMWLLILATADHIAWWAAALFALVLTFCCWEVIAAIDFDDGTDD